MKKIVLVALAVLMSCAAFAQYKVAPKVNDMKNFKGLQKSGYYTAWKQAGTFVEGIDVISGDTINIQNYLNEDKYVLIDFSCTWCGPCWNLHNSGLLEQVQELSNFQVIWCEIESTNTTAQLYGPQGGSSYADATYGNWTLTADGDTVPYPIIDDASFLTPFQTLYEGYVPTLMLVAPNGMYCNLDGYFSYLYVTESLQLIQALAQTCPQEGYAPQCAIDGSANALAGSACTFEALYNSAETVSDITWTADGQSTTTGSSATFTWNTAGTYNVILSVTNISGTDYDTLAVTVIEMNDNVLSYTFGMELSSYVGTNSTTDPVYWAAMFPADRVHGSALDHVDCYIGADYPATYTCTIYQGGTTAPETQVATVSQNVTAAMGDAYVTFPLSGNIDASKNLWVVMSATATYPCAGVAGTMDANGNWISTDGSQWYHLNEASTMEYTWMIDCYLSGSAQGIQTLSNAQVALYPNPTTSIVNVKAEGLQQVEVLDVNGRSVMTVNANTVDMSNLSNGIYMFRVLTNNGVSMQKVVKK